MRWHLESASRYHGVPSPPDRGRENGLRTEDLSLPPTTSPFRVNGRDYTPPARPVAVVCIDGCADEYLDAAMVRGRMPHLSALAERGFRGFARAALPSFTNTNNASITTGVPPAEHGISGNFFFDRESGEEVMMNSASYLRAPTILAAAARAGRRVAAVTAKDKLRALLAHDLSGIAFSAERADEAQAETHGIGDVERLVGAQTPKIYSADASLFVLEAGVRLVEESRADFAYLSLTDFMQHKYSPDEDPALEFYAGIDDRLGRLAAAGVIVGITADHGMNAKQHPDGSPKVVFLESILTAELGPSVRVILPITDPYVVHHGALGSYATVYLPEGVDRAAVARRILSLHGITEVHERSVAARELELPADRIGDLVVLAGRDTTIGRTPEKHDLSAVARGLRSHGGRYEEMVPFIVSEPLRDSYSQRALGDLRNFDIFDFAVNGVS